MYEIAKNQLDFEDLGIERLEDVGIELYDFGPIEL